MRILFTRHKQESRELEIRARAQGYSPFFEELLNIRPLEPLPFESQDVQGVVVSSAHGAQRLVLRAEFSHLVQTPFFAVGAKTALWLENAGVLNLHIGNGGLKALIPVIQDRLPIDDGAVVHARGADIAYSLKEELSVFGYQVRELILYKAEKRNRFSADLQDALLDAPFELVVFFSLRQAEAFFGCLALSKKKAVTPTTVFVCFSKRIAAGVKNLTQKQEARIVALESPVMEALYDFLETSCTPHHTTAL